MDVAQVAPRAQAEAVAREWRHAFRAGVLAQREVVRRRTAVQCQAHSDGDLEAAPDNSTCGGRGLAVDLHKPNYRRNAKNRVGAVAEVRLRRPTGACESFW